MSRPISPRRRRPGHQPHRTSRRSSWPGRASGRAARRVVRTTVGVDEARMLVVAGGFSLRRLDRCGPPVRLRAPTGPADGLGFVAAGRPVIGICNGFQTLVRAGLLPGPGQRAALGHNASGSFDCRWVTLAPSSQRCVWTKDLRDEIDCPIAHGEGRFVADPTTLADLQANDQIALRYSGATGNPNGSLDDIAGICDPSGVVLGLMLPSREPRPAHSASRPFPWCRRAARAPPSKRALHTAQEL
ncbi:MAG: phosphoribosylformylglycinamidine synthase subunit PurQ [Ilumatobacteraceae bacterium]